MNNLLTKSEKNLMHLLIQGHNYQGISMWMDLDYLQYIKIKKSLLKKLKVNRVTQLITYLTESGTDWEFL